MDKNYWIVKLQDNKRKLFRHGWVCVLHGSILSTDSISFMLDGLKKPVIFTGSQIP